MSNAPSHLAPRPVTLVDELDQATAAIVPSVVLALGWSRDRDFGIKSGRNPASGLELARSRHISRVSQQVYSPRDATS